MHLSRISILLFAFILISGLAVPLNAAGETGVRDVQQHADSLSFTLQTAAASFSPEGEVAVSGLDVVTGQPGAPALPAYSTLIAVPPAADVVVDVRAADVVQQQVSTIRPVADYVAPAGETIRSPDELEPIYAPDAALYAADQLYPATLYELSEPMYSRDLRVVRLTLYPLRYNPAGGILEHSRQLAVDVQFVGGTRADLRAAPAVDGGYGSSVLNPEQAAQWRSLPESASALQTNFPIGVLTYKIEVNKDGIYELEKSDIPAITSSCLKMMYQGQDVYYQIANDNGNSTFDSGERIRFYGWAFDGSRHDRQFVGNNVFWLWESNSGCNKIQSQSNGSGGGFTPVSQFVDTLTFEQNNYLIETQTNKWPTFDNPADAWYWSMIRMNENKSFSVSIPDPAAGGSATVLVELFSRLSGDFTHNASVSVNSTSVASRQWPGRSSRNVSGSISTGNLNNGSNNVSVAMSVNNNPQESNYDLNRITVTYPRQLKAVDNQLIVDYPPAGKHRFEIGNFTSSSAIVWNISNRLQPAAINVQPDVFSSGGKYVYPLQIDNGANATMIAAGRTHKPARISSYTASSIEAPGGAVDWIAISPAAFMNASNDLAAHRRSFRLKTHVVDVQDVINQYGYGLATPAGIQAYLRHALVDWNVTYAILMGDATINPLQRACTPTSGDGRACPGEWNTTEKSWVPVDLVFEDRFSGLVPSDHTYAALIGNDQIPDIAVGRLTGATATEIQQMVNKIKTYEGNLVSGEAYTKKLTWVADKTDSGGNFCAENSAVRNALIPGFLSNPYILCGDSYGSVSQMTPDLANAISNGTGLINYRGHGSVQTWGKTDTILEVDDAALWFNFNKPSVIFSADCLDGYFAAMGTPALSETFLALPNGRGTAAHWSSAGLGFSNEHTVLQEGFYKALYDLDLETIGAATRYSKEYYLLLGKDVSEVYAFILQGDPAMHMPLDGKLKQGFSLYLPITRK